jgi:hypothetical protein
MNLVCGLDPYCFVPSQRRRYESVISLSEMGGVLAADGSTEPSTCPGEHRVDSACHD